ncbi:MAG: DUF4430 domain-containing protein [Floccifex porci]|uniref:DUF4430 domain-containing protein n=1 Tax=Floccifex porci TaxID=2606629 RepID=UPI0023F0B2A0|nr:DUF4430 domain-containing protein [Floccifex porci]MCI7802199.1 DUF4430 domain-containing protein [Erysipelotrichaceae bacterium]MDD7467094.1 DUF4430 domain-containing protein [Floccifex porci]MDY4797121.1 DUF4430 domain-containing protein [Floccifex porci]
MKKKKVLWSILVVAILAIVLIVPNMLSKSKKAGTIDVIVEDVNEEVIKQKSIDFQKDEKCSEVIQNNFDNVLIENGMILNIESLETPEDWSEFICIYVNDEMSQVGIEDIVLEDGMKISFVMTEYEY